ncbi:MAG: c(7)-type cytochrome triheme domain-containing protein [Thermodesulfobacteriota bacterium]
MMPAPEDRQAEGYDKQEGATITRDKWGVMDPTPSVIPLEYLPKDKYGFVDWAQAMREGKISPKDSILGKTVPTRPAFNEDVLIRSKLKFMADVNFPHSAHNEWLDCAPCHPKMFKKKAGATNISMLAIWKGQFCGRCHDKVAFPIRNCFKCHSVKSVDERRQTRTRDTAE